MDTLEWLGFVAKAHVQIVRELGELHLILNTEDIAQDLCGHMMSLTNKFKAVIAYTVRHCIQRTAIPHEQIIHSG